MSVLTDSFDDLLDVQEEVLGRREEIVVTGEGTIDILLNDVALDPQAIAGGIAEDGSYSGLCRRSDFSDTNEGPAIGTATTFRGNTLQILTVATVNETFRVTIGDISAE